MLVKLELGSLVYVPKSCMYDGKAISNYYLLPEATLLTHGWKYLIEKPMPAKEDGYTWRTYYEEDDDGISIRQEWEKVATPPIIPSRLDELEDSVEDLTDVISAMMGVE